jgi:hypothetical protein
VPPSIATGTAAPCAGSVPAVFGSSALLSTEKAFAIAASASACALMRLFPTCAVRPLEDE